VGDRGPTDFVSVTSGRVASWMAVPLARGEAEQSGRFGVRVDAKWPEILLSSPQVMGTPGLISRWGLKTTATVGAAFRGFIPIPRANRIRPARIWGGYRLSRRSQRVIEWQCGVTRVCAQCPFIECVRAGRSCTPRHSAASQRGHRSRFSRAGSQSQLTTSSRVNCGYLGRLMSSRGKIGASRKK
jgi:hypothetical protein